MLRPIGTVALMLALVSCGEAPQKPWRQVDLCAEPPVERNLAGWRGPCERGLGTLRGRSFRTIRVRPGGRIGWRLALGTEPRLSFRPIAEGDACPYLVVVRDRDRARTVVLREAFTPTGHNVAEPVSVDLTPFEESSILLLLMSPETPNERCEIAHFASPFVVFREPAEEVRRAAATRPNILLIGVDTLRADALGAYRDGASITPAIDRLARESDLWLNAFTVINNTNPSFISMMTGLYPKNHGVYNLKTPLPNEATTLAELLREAGYATRAVVAARHLGTSSGLDQGFEKFVSPTRQYFGETVVNQGIEWMQQIDRPFFIWLHLFDPHVPHNPPHPYDLGYRAARLEGLSPMGSWIGFRDIGPREFDPRTDLEGHLDLYPGEVAYVDRQIDRLLSFMESRGLLDETVVALVADHGETLGERGQLFNHVGLHDNTTHVPLMIRWPGAKAGRRLSGLVQHLDLFPTLLEAAGLTPPERDGVDLRRQADDGARGRRAVFAEHAGARGWMVRTAKYKLLADREGELALYDLEKDPAETNDLAGTGLAVEAELAELLKRWIAARRELVAPVELEITEEERKELEALGYVD